MTVFARVFKTPPLMPRRPSIPGAANPAPADMTGLEAMNDPGRQADTSRRESIESQLGDEIDVAPRLSRRAARRHAMHGLWRIDEAGERVGCIGHAAISLHITRQNH